ncbi:unnamed protein product [Didymodactylos carnosus]|uniref:B box-type domain-containing protein n=1 Tax=Didymodactylos carnosus TaxID=1234261 RepID=A0A815Q8C6_9BILA|nr:unnamed protein product [Didymodactylos carnosus]CAF1458925.1 unnamed protein product [Didymodactylos carnosus]CAF4114172.1 unnamed protein product [Didymodactylos carnosus]CAF4329844.1 unnamed protein product [Didymodactylos carnosus]
MQLAKNNGGSFECPMRDGTTINERAITALPVNSRAEDMVEYIEKMSLTSPEQQQVQCDNCSDQLAVHWCEKCGTNYCDSCTQFIHSAKALKAHIVIPLAQKPRLFFCTAHPDAKYRFWCEQCKLPVCRDCLLMQHKNHPYASIEDAAAGVRAQLQSSLQWLEKKEEKPRQFLTKINGLIEEQKELYRTEETDIEKLFAELRKALEDQQRSLTDQLKTTVTEILSQLEKHQKRVNEDLRMLEVQKHYTAQLRDTKDDLELLQKTNPEKETKTINEINSGLTAKHITQITQEELPTVQKRLVLDPEKLEKFRCELLSVAHVKAYVCWNLSSPTGKEEKWNMACLRGYQFQLRSIVNLRSVQVKANVEGPLFVYVVDEHGKIIRKSIGQGTGSMSWIKVPTVAELKTAYGVFFGSDNGIFAARYDGSSNVRTVNLDCSVESKFVDRNGEQRTDTVLSGATTVPWSLEMQIEIET